MLQISTKIRYGTRALIHLAFNYQGNILSLREIAEKEQLSEKYLGGILVSLKAARLVDSEKGKYGGYRLTRHPTTITLFDIVMAFETNILVNNDNPTDSGSWDNLAWKDVESTLIDRLKSISITDIIQKYQDEQNILQYQI